MDPLAHFTTEQTEAQGKEGTAPGHRALEGIQHHMGPWDFCFSQVPSLLTSGLTHSHLRGEAF